MATSGEFELAAVKAYWSWDRSHTQSERFPRGESVDEALLRYAHALRRLLSRTEPVTLVVVHEFARHHITAPATTSPSLFPHPHFANALPYLFDGSAIERAAVGIAESAQ